MTESDKKFGIRTIPVKKAPPLYSDLYSIRGGAFLSGDFAKFFSPAALIANTCYLIVLGHLPAAGGNFLSFLTPETSFFNEFLPNLPSNPEKKSA